jgi:hypothetical protein
MSKIRLNWVAILVAAIASFIFEALWFSVFLNEWLAGIGRTHEWLMSSGMSPALQYGVAILCAVIAAAVLSLCIQASGEHSAHRRNRRRMEEKALRFIHLTEEVAYLSFVWSDYDAASLLTPTRATCDAVLYGLIFPEAVLSR